MDGISLFADEFSGELGFISFIVKGINNDINSANALIEFLIELNPHYLFLYNYSCKGFEPVNSDFKSNLKELYSDVEFKVNFKF